MRKITITVDDATLDCLRAMREFNGVPYSVAIRLAVLSYYHDKVSLTPTKKIGRLCVSAFANFNPVSLCDLPG